MSVVFPAPDHPANPKTRVEPGRFTPTFYWAARVPAVDTMHAQG